MSRLSTQLPARGLPPPRHTSRSSGTSLKFTQHVRPSAAAPDRLDTASTDAIPARDLYVAQANAPQNANNHDIPLAQLRIRIPTSTRTTPPRGAITRVLGVGCVVEMVGPHTTAVIAGMATMVLWPMAPINRKRNAVCRLCSAIQLKLAVAMLVSIPLPLPTSGSVVNSHLLPESRVVTLVYH